MNAVTHEAPAIVIPQITIASAPAVEVRMLGNGKRIYQAQMLEETADLNKTVEDGFVWVQESPHQLFALRSPLTHKNAKGAYSYDESIEPDWYWTNEVTPWYEGGRVVVGFDYGGVGSNFGYFRCLARAVRVARE
ncbi:hypothetical protein [Solilutibacter silvestris]|uniref:hypothetical protein n=1 Tax=Solilutibacter silvestris TaxID=1645665 RepID=UPI003D347577